MIQNLYLILFLYGRSRNDEHFQYFSDLRKIFEKFPDIKAKVKALFDTLVQCHEAEDVVVKKIKKNDLTKIVTAFRKNRRRTYRGLINAHHSMMNHFDPMNYEAAERIKVVLDTYGNVTRKPLNEETSAIYNLIKELNENHLADVKYLKLTDWLDRLSAENDALNSAVLDRDHKNALKPKAKVKEARAATDEAYLALSKCINGLILYEGKGEYNDFVSDVNKTTERFNLTMMQRLGRAKAKKGDKTPDKEPEKPKTPDSNDSTMQIP